MIAVSLGFWLWLTVALCTWIVFAFWPARVAARKAHSFLGSFIFRLFFFPTALNVAYAMTIGSACPHSSESEPNVRSSERSQEATPCQIRCKQPRSSISWGT